MTTVPLDGSCVDPVVLRVGANKPDKYALAAIVNRHDQPILVAAYIEHNRSLRNMSALRNISFRSIGLDQSAAFTTLTQARSGCSAPDRPERFQNSLRVLTAMIRNGEVRRELPGTWDTQRRGLLRQWHHQPH
jgi:hypothetical protein